MGSTGEAWGPAADAAGENPFARPCSRKALPEDRHLPLPAEHEAQGFAAGNLSCCPPRRGKQHIPGQSTKQQKPGQPRYLSLKASRKPCRRAWGFREVTLSRQAKLAGRPPMRCQVEPHHCFTKLGKSLLAKDSHWGLKCRRGASTAHSDTNPLPWYFLSNSNAAVAEQQTSLRSRICSSLKDSQVTLAQVYKWKQRFPDCLCGDCAQHLKARLCFFCLTHHHPPPELTGKTGDDA